MTKTAARMARQRPPVVDTDVGLAFEPIVSVFFGCANPTCCEYRRDIDRQCMDIGYCTYQIPEQRSKKHE